MNKYFVQKNFSSVDVDVRPADSINWTYVRSFYQEFSRLDFLIGKEARATYRKKYNERTFQTLLGVCFI